MAANSENVVYAGYTQDELNRQYDIEAASPGFGELLRKYAELSAATRARRKARLDVSYGDGPGETLDLFPSEGSGAAPIVLFIHGGGWRGSNKESRAFPADLYCPAGAVFISLEYPLAPAHTLDQMASAVRTGIAWAAGNARDFGADPGRIVVVGNSAGGHLAAIAATGNEGLRLAGVVTISGVFDMKPLQLTRANSWLNMDDAMVLRNSPIHRIPQGPCPLTACVGAEEPSEFRRQSRAFAQAWQNRGGKSRYVEVDGHSHFSVIGLVGESGNVVSDSILAFAGLDAGA